MRGLRSVSFLRAGHAGWLVLLLAALAALAIAWVEYRGLRAIDVGQPRVGLDQVRSQVPWGGYAGGVLADSLQYSWRVDPAAAEDAFAWHLEHYPLHPYRWLDRASIGRARQMEPERVMRHVEAGVSVHPGNREINWLAASLAIQLGRMVEAEDYLRRWLDGQPGQVARVLFMAGRWLDDPGDLLDRVVPEGEDYLSSVLALARRTGNLDLAAAVWSRLSVDPGNDTALLDYVDLLLATGEIDQAVAVWRKRFPDFAIGQVPNADFRHALGPPRGFNWDTRVPAGASVVRDHGQFVTEPASLRVMFDGSENLQLRRPTLRIPVDPETARWELSGHWRANRLTTRNLPYLAVRVEGGSWKELAVPGANFDWAAFRMEVDNPEGGTMLELQLRRDRPRVDFDRYLAGEFWLDALRLAPVPEH